MGGAESEPYMKLKFNKCGHCPEKDLKVSSPFTSLGVSNLPSRGGVAEWFKALVLKTSEPLRVP